MKIVHVQDYGAVGDDRFDNTGVFSAALDDLIQAGGGRMVIPAGVCRGRIILPPFQAPSWISIEIVGAGRHDTANAWQRTAFNLSDPDNLGTGDIACWVVEGGVGAVDSFTRRGGAKIRARRIGGTLRGESNRADTGMGVLK
jgi:hypothetical protein